MGASVIEEMQRHPKLCDGCSCAASILVYRSQLGGTGRADPDVSIQPFLGGIPLLERCLPDRGSLTGYSSDGKRGIGRQ
jgi:hypothetical protein